MTQGPIPVLSHSTLAPIATEDPRQHEHTSAQTYPLRYAVHPRSGTPFFPVEHSANPYATRVSPLSPAHRRTYRKTAR